MEHSFRLTIRREGTEMTTTKYLWLGFGSLLALLFVSSSITIIRLAGVRQSVTEVMALAHPDREAESELERARANAEANARTIQATVAIKLLACILIGIAMAVIVGRRIAKTESTLRVTLASLGDAVILTDAAGGVTFVNPVAQTLTG